MAATVAAQRLLVDRFHGSTPPPAATAPTAARRPPRSTALRMARGSVWQSTLAQASRSKLAHDPEIEQGRCPPTRL